MLSSRAFAEFRGNYVWATVFTKWYSVVQQRGRTDVHVTQPYELSRDPVKRQSTVVQSALRSCVVNEETPSTLTPLRTGDHK